MAKNPNESPKGDVLFEVSWEVCNKVGGINTVIKSKAPFLKKAYNRFYFIGPNFDHQGVEFDERETPKELQEVFEAVAHRGVKCVFGAWLINGEPSVILINTVDLVGRRNEIKDQLWNRYGVDSLRSNWDFDEPMCFAIGAGMLIEEYAKRNKKVVVAQFHEWLAGFGLLHLKTVGSNVATVFTTHATMLGRTICANNVDLYSNLDKCNPGEWASRFGVQDKHTAEVACAKNADIFTTVSDITALEAEKLLGRKPDVVLPNGLTLEKFLTLEETTLKHVQSRERLKELLSYVFFPHYPFNLDKTVLIYTSGRYEFKNKGFDLLISSLARLNRRLQQEKLDVNVAFFFFVPMGNKGVKRDIIENKNFYYHIKQSIEWQGSQILQKIVYDFLSGQQPGQEGFFTGDMLKDLRADLRHFQRQGHPHIVMHDLDNEWQDAIVSTCRKEGLDNGPEDKVKIVVYPTYLDGTDNLLDMNYYDAVVGTQLGIFPSYYEPWGYTPLESVALGVPAITTELAGFGDWAKRFLHSDHPGVFILERKAKSFDESAENLANMVYNYITLDRSDRVQQSVSAKLFAEMCDWKNFVRYYYLAHNLAIDNAAARTNKG